jgi:hypothetical protein
VISRPTPVQISEKMIRKKIMISFLITLTDHTMIRKKIMISFLITLTDHTLLYDRALIKGATD